MTCGSSSCGPRLEYAGGHKQLHFDDGGGRGVPAQLHPAPPLSWKSAEAQSGEVESALGWIPFVLVIATISGAVCRDMAAYRGRSKTAWFCMGCLTGPLAILVIAVMGKTLAQIEKEGIRKIR